MAELNKVTYLNPSKTYGEGNIPKGSQGILLLEVKNSLTDKLLVDFGSLGIAIIPASTVVKCDPS